MKTITDEEMIIRYENEIHACRLAIECAEAEGTLEHVHAWELRIEELESAIADLS